MLENKYKYIPLFKGIGCILISGLAILSLYLYFKHKSKLPGILILFYAGPIAISYFYLNKSFYYFTIFNNRSISELKENRLLLNNIISEEKDFILYLRSHSLEKGAVIYTINRRTIPNMNGEMDIDMGRGSPFIHYPITNNIFEDNIIRPLLKYMPVFSLHSPKDDRMSVAMRILTKKTDWFKEVSVLIPKARFIIINFENITPGIVKELKCIAENNVIHKTLIVTTEKGVIEINDIFSDFIKKTRWTKIIKGNAIERNIETIELPLDFIEELES